VSESETEAAKSESFESESESVGSGGRVAEGIVRIGMVAVGGGGELGTLVEDRAKNLPVPEYRRYNEQVRGFRAENLGSG